MKRRAEDPSADAGAGSLALGFLALVPLLAAHEWGSAARGHELVNLGAVLLRLPLAPLGARAEPASWIVLGALALASLVLLFRADYALLPRLLRILGEGALAAVVLGPLLVFLSWALHLPGDPSHVRAGIPGSAPPLSLSAVLCGGAAFEELVFRLGVMSASWVLARRALEALGARERLARGGAELLALALSALAFAASHLERVVWVLAGPGGEPFDAAVFSWRFLAGILLGVLFRWRGMGVAAWAHALFNLALLIGAGPDVFL